MQNLADQLHKQKFVLFPIILCLTMGFSEA